MNVMRWPESAIRGHDVYFLPSPLLFESVCACVRLCNVNEEIELSSRITGEGGCYHTTHLRVLLDVRCMHVLLLHLRLLL